MTTKHTPGPWRWTDGGTDKPHRILASVFEIAALSYINGPEKHDAALIAAAPDLLKACEAWARAAHAGIAADPELWRAAETLSRDALAKAKGGA